MKFHPLKYKSYKRFFFSRRHPHASPDIYEQLLRSYVEVFNDTSKPLVQIHGSLCGLKELGIQVMLKFIISIIVCVKILQREKIFAVLYC